MQKGLLRTTDDLRNAIYDGAVKRELVGAEITERALVASALNIQGGEGGLRPGVAA